MQRICIFCGSQVGTNGLYRQAAIALGQLLVRHGYGLVYGGGHVGLMGVIADAVLASGGEVIGVIPEALVTAELAHMALTHLEIVANMHERKARFAELSDGFLTLPGGVGTMDELWEAVSWAQLGYHAKPIGLLNAYGFFDHLLAFNRHMIESGFIRPGHAGIIVTRDQIEPLIDAMEGYQPHQSIFGMKADDL